MTQATKSVLIVEDEKPLSHALELKLQHEGFETQIATNGEEAITLLQEKKFDVMLLDMMMPVVDGFQVLERLKTFDHQPVTFALSNLSLHDDQDRVLGMGAKHYYIKSDTPLSDIVEAVKNA